VVAKIGEYQVEVVSNIATGGSLQGLQNKPMNNKTIKAKKRTRKKKAPDYIIQDIAMSK